MFLGNDMHEVSDEKKVSYISLAYQTYKKKFSPHTIHFDDHTFMDMYVQGKNGRHEKQKI